MVEITGWGGEGLLVEGGLQGVEDGKEGKDGNEGSIVEGTKSFSRT